MLRPRSSLPPRCTCRLNRGAPEYFRRRLLFNRCPLLPVRFFECLEQLLLSLGIPACCRRGLFFKHCVLPFVCILNLHVSQSPLRQFVLARLRRVETPPLARGTPGCFRRSPFLKHCLLLLLLRFSKRRYRLRTGYILKRGLLPSLLRFLQRLEALLLGTAALEGPTTLARRPSRFGM